MEPGAPRMDSPGVEREPERMEGGTYFPLVEVEGGREEEGSFEAGASSSGPAPVSAGGGLVDRQNNGLERDKKTHHCSPTLPKYLYKDTLR